MEYQIGNVAILRGAFTSGSGNTPFDPVTVKLFLRTPAGVESTLVFGVDAGLVQEAIGYYRYDLHLLTATQCGRAYFFRWVGYDSTGAPVVAEESEIEVSKSHFRVAV